MVDRSPEFESSDTLGFTEMYAGTVGTTPIVLPSPATTVIDVALIRSPNQVPNSVVLSWSIDNITYHALAPGEYIGWEFRQRANGTDVTQIYVKGSTSGVKYEVTINRRAV